MDIYRIENTGQMQKCVWLLFYKKSGKGVSLVEDAIVRAEHEEFKRRMDEENARQNRRIELLEKSQQRLEMLNISIEKLAVNMESMLKEQLQQGERLGVLESRDGEMWRKVVGHAVTAVISIVIGYIFCSLGM